VPTTLRVSSFVDRVTWLSGADEKIDEEALKALVRAAVTPNESSARR
jgi:hypothetical protein